MFDLTKLKEKLKFGTEVELKLTYMAIYCLLHYM